jgi:osmotically inducible lipoprotein OsmB
LNSFLDSSIKLRLTILKGVIMKNFRKIIVPMAAGTLFLSLSACSGYSGLSEEESSTAVGAGLGGVAGSVLTDGPIGTLGGAAVGAVVGNEVTETEGGNVDLIPEFSKETR